MAFTAFTDIVIAVSLDEPMPLTAPVTMNVDLDRAAFYGLDPSNNTIGPAPSFKPSGITAVGNPTGLTSSISRSVLSITFPVGVGNATPFSVTQRLFF